MEATIKRLYVRIIRKHYLLNKFETFYFGDDVIISEKSFHGEYQAKTVDNYFLPKNKIER